MSILTAEKTLLAARIKAALARTDEITTPHLPKLQPGGDTYLGTLPVRLRHLWLCIEELRSEAACGKLEEECNMTPEEIIIECEDFFDHLLLAHFCGTRRCEVLHLRANWVVVSRPRH